MVLPRQSCYRRRLFGFPPSRERRGSFNPNTENEKALSYWSYQAQVYPKRGVTAIKMTLYSRLRGKDMAGEEEAWTLQI